MTEPLTPANCDLRDFPGMMVNIPRLRASAFDAIADDAAWRAGLNLWMTAFHSVPAGSLDNGEAELCKAAGLGRDLRTWKRVRGAALRGWIECTDGKLYHPTVAEVVLEAWLEKLPQRLSSGAGNAKRWGTVFDPETILAQIREAARLLTALAPESKVLRKVSRHISGGSPDGTNPSSKRDAPDVPLGSQEEDEVEGEAKGDKEGSAAAPRQADLLDLGDTPPQKPPTVAEIVPIDPLERARDAYNATVREVNARFGAAWSECNGLSDTRRKKLTLRLKECGGVQGWVEAMSRAADSPHLNGTAPRRAEYASWWPDFDFFLQAKSFTRLLEGSYDAKPGKASDGSGGSFLEAAGRVAARDTAGGP